MCEILLPKGRQAWHVQNWKWSGWVFLFMSLPLHPCLLQEEKTRNSLVLWTWLPKRQPPESGRNSGQGDFCHWLQMTRTLQETPAEDTNCGPPKLLLRTARQEPVFASNLSGLILFFSNNWKLMSWSESRCSCHLLNWDIKWGSVDGLTNLTVISLSQLMGVLGWRYLRPGLGDESIGCTSCTVWGGGSIPFGGRAG